MKKAITNTIRFFDHLNETWESKKGQKFLALILVYTFLVSLLLSFIKYLNLVSPEIEAFLPANIFTSIEISFSLLLLIEIVSLVFSLSHSITASVVKQLEILSLILLRNAFKQFGEFYQVINWENYSPIISMLLDAFGAMVIFVIILLIYRTLKHLPITEDPASQTRFIIFKKLTGLGLFLVFLISGFYDISLYLHHEHPFDFFKTFYTILIFTDIFLVLVALRYNFSYIVVFRNSAFAVATVIIRMALSAPIYYNIALGVLAALFIFGITYFYTKFRHCQSQNS
jgi:hypothetical protein